MIDTIQYMLRQRQHKCADQWRSRGPPALNGLDASGRPANKSIPDVLLVGCYKCGTTSLWRYICQLPGFQCMWKETRCFSMWVQWNGGLCPGEILRWWVAGRYGISSAWSYIPCNSATACEKPAEPNRRLIDGTIDNLAEPFYAPQMVNFTFAVSSQPRLVFLLRQPSDRALSHWRFRTRVPAPDSGVELWQHSNPWALNASVHKYMIESSFGLFGVRKQTGAGTQAAMRRLLTAPWDARHFHVQGRIRGLTRISYSHNSVAGGWYALQLYPWFNMFPSRHHVIIFEEMVGGSEWRAALGAFLGTGKSIERMLPHENSAKNSMLPNTASNLDVQDVRGRLDAHYKPYNEMLCNLLERWNYTAAAVVQTHWRSSC